MNTPPLFLAFGLVELLIVVAIMAIIALLIVSTMAATRAKAVAQLRAQLAGTWTTPPASPVTSTPARIHYTLALGPTAIAITPASPIHSYLTLRANFALTGNGGAAFLDGSRAFSVPMGQTGQAVTAIRAVANGTDHLKVTYTATDVKSGAAVAVAEPVEHDFETQFP